MSSKKIISYLPKSCDSKDESFKKASIMADAKNVRISVKFDGVEIIVYPKSQLEAGVPIDAEERGLYYFGLYRRSVKERQNVSHELRVKGHYRNF